MIRKRKDVRGLPAPWTNDPILQNFRFTNVKREHDRETIWLFNNVINNPTIAYEDKLINIMLFRMYNKSATMEVVYGEGGHPLLFSGMNKIAMKNIRANLQEALDDDPKYTYFTNAFLTCGLKVALGNQEGTHDDFMPMRPIKFAKQIWDNGVIDRIKKAKDQKEVFDIIRSNKGLGQFLAYQIFVDFTYIPEFPFSENEFTVSGPGCARGLRNIFEDFDGLNDEEALFWLRDNIDEEFNKRGFKWNPDKLFDDLPEYDRHMNVMSLENCMCEISKYIRAVNGTGRPKNRYRSGI